MRPNIECPDDFMQGRLGIVVGESTPIESTVLVDMGVEALARAGSHVVTSDGSGCRIGVIEMLLAGSDMLTRQSSDYEVVDRMIRTYAYNVEKSLYMRARIRWLSYVDALLNDRVETPKRPVKPGTEVYFASGLLLEQIFNPNSTSWLKIGRLASSSVDFSINVEKLMRHLAILAVTGGGKSNTVCVLATGLVSRYRATIAIFDVHGEYSKLRDNTGLPVNVVNGALNPVAVNYRELLQLIGMPSSAHQQRRLLLWLWSQVLRLHNAGRLSADSVLTTIEKILEEMAVSAVNSSKPLDQRTMINIFENVTGFEPDTSRRPPPVKLDQVLGVLSKLDDLKYYGNALDDSLPRKLEEVIKPGHLNVIDLSSLDETQADAVVSHYLRRLLEERKNARRGMNGYPTPVIVVIEEAHVLIPKDEDTLTRYWAARIAREGRKFGVGLVIVSQRPKKLDSDVLSQTNNKIILRIVEPSDISYVQAATEEMSEDIARLLPTLDTGEAVVLGSMTKMPALVKIDKCSASTGGTDIDPVSEWMRWAGSTGEEASDESLKEYF